MLRGTLVLWAGLLTIVVLHRRLHIHHWFGMVLIVAGAAVVGASRYVLPLAPYAPLVAIVPYTVPLAQSAVTVTQHPGFKIH